VVAGADRTRRKSPPSESKLWRSVSFRLPQFNLP
jgi:hypothetical protein